MAEDPNIITVTTVKHYVRCPSCQKAAAPIDHLEGAQQLIWYCDECGQRFSFSLTVDKKVINLVTRRDRKEKRLVLLRHGNVGLIVEGIALVEAGKESEADAYHGFFYDEHTCPVNYMRDVKAVVDLENMDTDPHGIFQYVKTLPWNEAINSHDSSLSSMCEHSLAFHFGQEP